MSDRKKQVVNHRRHENIRTGESIEALKQAILEHLYFIQGRVPEVATRNDWYMAVGYAVRDRLIKHWVPAYHLMSKKDHRAVAYLSAEFLMGPHLGNALINLGIYEHVREAVAKLGLKLDDLLDQEEEPGLGNGGLGRLAACFLDSLATLRIGAIGYGVRYEFGIFDQTIRDGWQVEVTDKWLNLGNPWEIPRPELACSVKLGGHTETFCDEKARYRVRWIPRHEVKGVPYDTPVPGYLSNMANVLRLWKSEACESFDFKAFNVGDYYRAVEEKVTSETLSKILYPNDEPMQGKVLRLAQQYFFVSCSLQDMIRMHLLTKNRLDSFHKKFAVQLNDTHPSIGVAELMRLLVDEHSMDWDAAWRITQSTFAYTNHTLLPEALEKWSLPLFREVLPRHLEIIYEINRQFLDEVRRKYPDDDARVRNLSLIDETHDKYVRMANLASLGSHAINGVAELHSDLLKKTVLRDFYELYPERFHNITNGVTPRRWVMLINPGLAKLITQSIGEGWILKPETLRKLEKFSDNAGFQRKWLAIKKENKRNLAAFIKERTGIIVDPDTLFDLQVKRFHEYKRQHLNILHVVTLYNRLRKNACPGVAPRTVIFGGKAAPGYFMAKLVIKLINSIAEVINNDPDIRKFLRVVFLPDFNVKNSQRIYPAADLSEQISTAGKEASGTGNMKFSMNGALTIGTLDGANIEIREEVGAENFFLFGLETKQVNGLRVRGYNPREYYESNAELREAIDLISSGHFSRGDQDLFKPLVNSLLTQDEYLVLADYPSYIDCQKKVDKAFQDQRFWNHMSILNVARTGKFSSDRSIREYAERIWKVKPYPKDSG